MWREETSSFVCLAVMSRHHGVFKGWTKRKLLSGAEEGKSSVATVRFNARWTKEGQAGNGALG